MNNSTKAAQKFGGLVLAGGKSVRMGTDKAQLVYRGRTLLDHMKAILVEVGADPVLHVGGTGGLVDPAPDCGPVAGLVALLDHVEAGGVPPIWLVVPVDMPLLSAGMLKRLLQAEAPLAHFVDQTLPLALRVEDEVAGWLARMRPALAEEGGVSLWRFLNDLKSVVVAPASEDEARLANINTPEDWAAARTR